MAVLLIAEHDNQGLRDATSKAMTAALQLGSDVHVLVAGKNAQGAAAEAAKLEGVKKVLLCEADCFERPLAEPLAALVVSLAPSYDTIVAAATTNGKNYAPRIAALLDVMQISEITAVKSPPLKSWLELLRLEPPSTAKPVTFSCAGSPGRPGRSARCTRNKPATRVRQLMERTPPPRRRAWTVPEEAAGCWYSPR